jgi:two-component system, OmpR family, phosphate regulon sensor histidine kinase PhoR
MPLAQPPSSVAPAFSRPRPRSLWMGALVGPAAMLLLAVLGAARPGPAIFLAAVSALIGLYLSMRRGRAVIESGAVSAMAPAAVDRGPPYALILENLPDPLMVIAAEEPHDLTGRRFVFANAAARELFRIQRQGGFLVTAMRNPQVLEAVDESLFGGLERSVAYETGGA